MAVQAILSNFMAFAAPAGAPSARLGVGLAASFAELLADELQQAAPSLPPSMPVAQAPPPQLYPWIAVPVVVPPAREEKPAKKRPPARGYKRSGRR